MKKLLLLLLLVPMVSFGQTAGENWAGVLLAKFKRAEDLNNRGKAKLLNKDYYGAIGDYSEAIELYETEYYYSNRGDAKALLKDYYGAIEDYSKAIDWDPDYDYAYSNRGLSKAILGDLNGACADWRKAASLGDEEAAQWVRYQCN